MLIVYKAQDISEAHIVAGMLQANGIEAHVGGYYVQGAIGDIGTLNLANVHVSDEDVPLARSIIREYEGNDQKPVDDTTERVTSRRLGNLVIGFAVVFIILLFIALDL
jgi:hypothetical protein